MLKWRIVIGLFLAIAGVVLTIKYTRYYVIPKNFKMVEKDLFRGGKQSDRVFGELLETYKFKTVVSLTGEFKEQEKAAVAGGAKYVFYAWRGSGVGPFNEYKEAALLLANPASRPAFFHCYAGDKRSNATTFAVSLEEGMSAEQAFARLEQFGFSKTEDTTLYQHLKEYAAWREIQNKDALQPKPPSDANSIIDVPIAAKH